MASWTFDQSEFANVIYITFSCKTALVQVITNPVLKHAKSADDVEMHRTDSYNLQGIEEISFVYEGTSYRD